MYLRGFLKKKYSVLLKRIFIFALSMIFACSSFDVVVLAEVMDELIKGIVAYEVDRDKTAFSGGSGTEEDPYLISTVSDLTNIRFDGDLYYVLTNDIYINEGNNYINDWSEMGDGSSAGHIDGKGYTIYGLYNAPLFGAGSNYDRLYISNLNLKNVYYDTISHGVGFSSSITLIENCSIQGTIKTEEAGKEIGCIGRHIKEVINCTSDVDVYIPNSSVSGIAVSAGRISYCYNYGSLCGEYVNGIFNYWESSYKEATEKLEHCYNYGDLNGDYVNGIAKRISHSRGAYTDSDTNKKIYMENCFNYGTIQAEKEGNGICSEVYFCSENEEYVDELYINNCNNYGEVLSRGKASGIFQYLTSSTYSILSAENCNNWGRIVSSGRTGGVFGYISGHCSAKINILNCKNKGEVLVEEVLGEKETESIGGIIGEINQSGKGYNIQGASVISIQQCTNSGDIILESSDNISTWVGGVIGSVLSDHEVQGMEVLVEDCANTGDLLSDKNVSGICGVKTLSVDTSVEYNIRNCYNVGNITSYSHAHGLADGRGIIIENCYNSGEISGDYACVASVEEQKNSYGNILKVGEINNCYNIGKLSGEYARFFWGDDSECSVSNIYCLKGTVKSEQAGHRYLSSEQMKNAANFIGFDFDTIWKMDNAFYGYPVLQSNAHQSSLPDIMDTELGVGEVRVQVVNGKGHAIKDATVTLSETELKTDENGTVTFSDITSDEATITVEAAGYSTKTEIFDLEECNNLCKIVMSKRGLNSVTLSYNGNTYNLLLEEKKISEEDKDTEFTITCEVTEDIQDDVSMYKLVRENDEDGTSSIVMSSSDGIFYLKTEQLSQGNKFYICGYNNAVPNQQLFKTQINLNVIKAVKKVQKSQMDLGKDLAFTVGDDVPIFGGQKISLDGITALPVYTEINDETVKVGFNINVGKLGTDEKTQKRKWQGMKETLKKSLTGKGKTFFDNLKEYSDGTYKLGKNPSVSVAVAGYAEGPVSGEKLTGKLYVCLSVSGSKETQIPYTPIVAAFDITGKIGGGGETTFYFTTSDFEGNCYAEGSIAVTGSLGVGFAYVASVGVYGKGELSTKYIIAPKDVSGFEYWKLSGEAGVQARFLGKSSAKWRIIDGTYYLYKRDASTIDKESIVSSQDMMDVLTNPDLYTTIVHEQMKQEIADVKHESVSQNDISVSQNDIVVEREKESVLVESESGVSQNWVGSVTTSMKEIDTTFVEKDSYIDAKPQIVTAGDDIIMLYLTANPTRNAQNASMLVYSVYDGTNNCWSEPQGVYDDGTADYNPVVYESELGAYVVWNNSTTAVEDGTDLSLEETAYGTDLYALYYDPETNSFVNGKQVKDIGLSSGNIISNDIYESNATIMQNNDSVYYAWCENSEKDVFGLNGTNTIYLAEEANGSLIKKQIASVDKAITDLYIGKVGDEVYLAYTYDNDGDLSDISDMNIYVQKVADEATEAAHVYEGGVSDLQFNVYKNENMLIWYSAGNYHAWDGTEIATMFEEETLWGGDFSYFTDAAGNPYMIFSGSADEGSNRYLMSHNSLTSEWNLPVLIAESANYMEQMDSIVTNGKVLSVYNVVSADIEQEEWVEESNLGSLITGEFCDLSIADINYLAADFQKGSDFPVTISVINNGTVAVGQMSIGLKDSESNIVAQVSASEEIQPGATKEIECELSLPSDISNGAYSFFVQNSDVTITERNNEDNVKEVALGVTDIQTSAQLYCLNGHYSVNTTVVNKGLNSSSVTLNIKNYNTGEVHYSTSVEALEAGASYHFEIPLQNIGIPETEESALCVEVTSDDENEVEGNNIAYISVIPTNTTSSGNGNSSGGSSSGGSSGNISGGNSGSSATAPSVIKVKKIKLTGISKKIAAGKKIKLTATITPSNATNKAVKWTTSNKKYATVNSKGVVTVKKAGIGKTVKITATAKDGSGKKATYKIKIMKHKVTSVKLKASRTSVKAGKSVKVKATVKTNGKKVNKTLKWTSSNTKYATVNKKGVVKTKKAGKGKTVTITATSTDGTNKKAKVKIKIK